MSDKTEVLMDTALFGVLWIGGGLAVVLPLAVVCCWVAGKVYAINKPRP